MARRLCDVEKTDCGSAIKTLTAFIGVTGGFFTGMLWNKKFYGQATRGDNSGNYTYGFLLVGFGVLAVAVPKLYRRYNDFFGSY